MIRTIIADNEVWVCKLIADMVDWQSLGFSVVGLAYDGISLRDMIVEQVPDLVVTDIQMPGMTGIEIIRYIKDHHLPTKAIIISGYNDFEYAKAAIDFGVLGYLLKPVEKDVLTDILRKVRESRLSVERQKREFSLLHEQLQQSRQQHFALFVKELIADRHKRLSVNIVNTQFDRSFQDDAYRVLLICADAHSSGGDPETRSRVLGKVMDLCTHTFATACHELFCMAHSIYAMAIVNYNAGDEKLIKNLCGDLLYNCSISVPHISRFDLTFGVGVTVSAFSGIGDSYRAALDAVHSRGMLGPNQVIYRDQLPDVDVELVGEFAEQVSSYVNCYADMDGHSLTDMVFHASQAAAAPPYAPYDLARSAFAVALQSVSDEVCTAFRAQHDVQRFDLALELAINLSQLRDVLAEWLLLLRNQCALIEGKSRNVIDTITAHIDKHFHEDIKLEDLAELVHFNANYLSELFKRETGINFSKYLALKRVEMAKVYLSDGRYRCNEVVKMVGYSDSKHFNRLFKSHVGVTPKQYQKVF